MKLLRTARLRDERAHAVADRAAAGREYLRNPWAYVQSLDAEPTVAPEFDAAACEAHFSKVFEDPKREHVFTDEKWQAPRPEPSVPYKFFSVSISSIKKTLRRKPNRSAPGPDGIPYVVFKRCPSLLRYIALIFDIVQRHVDVPDAWRVGVISLLFKKGGKPHVVGDFRPICLASALGKLFMSMFAASLTSWAVAAGVIDRTWQKGFMPGTSGCVEHAMRVVGALRDAKTHARSVHAAFIDLANAFGSASHGLIQYALWWNGLPAFVQQLVQHYYSALRVVIRTKAFTTEELYQWVGVFQGCPLSPIIFNLCLNLLYRLYATPEHAKLAYKFKESAELRVGGSGFADDIGLVTRLKRELQLLLDVTDRWLDWAGMKAKPVKCRAICFTRPYVDGGQLPFAARDPGVTISGVPIPPITDDDGFKLLGKTFYPSLSDEKSFAKLQAKLEERLQRLDECPLDGIKKVDAVRLALSSWVNWELTMYPFDTSKLEELDDLVAGYLRRWTRMAPTTTRAMFYMPVSRHGFGIKKIVMIGRQRQGGLLWALKHSSDRGVVALYEHGERRDGDKPRLGQPYRDLRAYEALTADDPAKKASARGFAQHIKAMSEAETFEHLWQLVVQGRALTAIGTAARHDPDWSSARLRLPVKHVEFGNKAVLDVLPTMANLHRMHKAPHNRCKHCGWIESMVHILNACRLQLEKYRYRHDCVLRRLADFFTARLADGVRFWVDLEGRRDSMHGGFPPSICPTNLRPDMVFFDATARRLWLVELTVPHEHGVVNAYDRKMAKYVELAEEINEYRRGARPPLEELSIEVLTIEVPSRGLFGAAVVSPVVKALSNGGAIKPPRQVEINELSVDVSAATLAASYWIWVSHRVAGMPADMPLL